MIAAATEIRGLRTTASLPRRLSGGLRRECEKQARIGSHGGKAGERALAAGEALSLGDRQRLACQPGELVVFGRVR